MIKIISSVPTKEVLTNIYDVCNKIHKDSKYFYTSEEVRKLKKNSNNIFIK